VRSGYGTASIGGIATAFGSTGIRQNRSECIHNPLDISLSFDKTYIAFPSPIMTGDAGKEQPMKFAIGSREYFVESI
jgi:hypothetical protein